jgi:hypothetical protein
LIFALTTPPKITAAAQVSSVYGITKTGNRVFKLQISKMGAANSATTIANITSTSLSMEFSYEITRIVAKDGLVVNRKKTGLKSPFCCESCNGYF